MTGPPTRQRLDMALFLGPACLLLAFFFLAPVVVNVVIAFTDMGRDLRITRFTTENVARLFAAMRRCRRDYRHDPRYTDVRRELAVAPRRVRSRWRAGDDGAVCHRSIATNKLATNKRWFS